MRRRTQGVEDKPGIVGKTVKIPHRAFEPIGFQNRCRFESLRAVEPAGSSKVPSPAKQIVNLHPDF